jgi:hypothetical protein
MAKAYTFQNWSDKDANRLLDQMASIRDKNRVLLQGFNDDYYKNSRKFEPLTDYLSKPIKNLKKIAEAQPGYTNLLNQLIDIVDDNSLSQLEILTLSAEFLGTLVDDFPFLMEDLQNINRGIQNLQQVGAVGEQGSLPESSFEPSVETGSTQGTEREELAGEILMNALRIINDPTLSNDVRDANLDTLVLATPRFKDVLTPNENRMITNELELRYNILSYYQRDYNAVGTAQEIERNEDLVELFNNSLTKANAGSIESLVKDEFKRLQQAPPSLPPTETSTETSSEPSIETGSTASSAVEAQPEPEPEPATTPASDRLMTNTKQRILRIINNFELPRPEMEEQILVQFNKAAKQYPNHPELINMQTQWQNEMDLATTLIEVIATAYQAIVALAEKAGEPKPNVKDIYSERGLEKYQTQERLGEAASLRPEIAQLYTNSLSRSLGIGLDDVLTNIFQTGRSRIRAVSGNGIIPARLHKKALKKLELEDKRRKKLAPKKAAAKRKAAAKKQKAIDKTQPVVDAIKQLEKEIKELREGKKEPKGTGAYSNANAFSFTQDKKTLAQARKQVKSGATGKSGRGIAKIPDVNKLKKEMEILMASHKAGNKGGRLTAEASKKYNTLLASGKLSKEEEKRMRNFMKRA